MEEEAEYRRKYERLMSAYTALQEEHATLSEQLRKTYSVATSLNQQKK
jgi:hypothetical protein